MAAIRKLRGKWQAMVRRKGLAPRSKSFDKRTDAEKWARDRETQVDVAGFVPDTKLAEQTTLAQILARYRDEISPMKRSAKTEAIRINAMPRRDVCRRSTIFTSQIPVDHWHAVIGDPTYADAILNCVVHNAHRINLEGESLRKTKSKPLKES
jgi:hypothetical protein